MQMGANDVAVGDWCLEPGPQAKRTGEAVTELGVLEDVGRRVEEAGGERVHDAGPIRAMDGHYEAMHGRCNVVALSGMAEGVRRHRYTDDVTAADEDGDLDLSSLTTPDLVAQMHDDLYDGLADAILEGTNILLGRGLTPKQVLDDALVEGMRIVGIDFRDGILFVPEVLLAANAMKGGMAILRPLLAETGAEAIGKVVIGTVKGDIHDIGKNLVAMMLEGAGFEVFDLGINTDVNGYLGAIDEHNPDILGMSALLTTTMPYMKVVIDTLIDKGRRNDVIVLVGGAPLNEDFANAVGADAYCRDAAVAAETATRMVLARRAARDA